MFLSRSFPRDVAVTSVKQNAGQNETRNKPLISKTTKRRHRLLNTLNLLLRNVPHHNEKVM